MDGAGTTDAHSWTQIGSTGERMTTELRIVLGMAMFVSTAVWFCAAYVACLLLFLVSDDLDGSEELWLVGASIIALAAPAPIVFGWSFALQGERPMGDQVQVAAWIGVVLVVVAACLALWTSGSLSGIEG